jgi:ankyrin repeat protein
VNTVNNNGWTALIIAARNNQLDVVISLMNHPRIDLNVQCYFSYTALHWAVDFNHPAIVAQLLSDDKIDFRLKNKWNYTPLKLATSWGKDECVKLFRQHGAPG